MCNDGVVCATILKELNCGLDGRRKKVIFLLPKCSGYLRYMNDVLMCLLSIGTSYESHISQAQFLIRCNVYHLHFYVNHNTNGDCKTLQHELTS